MTIEDQAHLPDWSDASDIHLDSIRLHVIQPDRPSSVGILLYPTILGVDEYMRRFAVEFATRGLTAAVWDPYKGAEISPDPPEMAKRSQPLQDVDMLADLTRITDYLTDDLDIREIGGIGWCFGGRVALLHAGSDPRISALAAYNPTMYSEVEVEIPTIGTMTRADFPGQTLDEIERARSIRGPVQLSRPESDFTHPTIYARLFDALCARQYPTAYEYYPGATHGFSYTPGEANARAHRIAWANTATLFSTLSAAS